MVFVGWAPETNIEKFRVFRGLMLVRTIWNELYGSHTKFRIRLAAGRRMCGSFRLIFLSVSVGPNPDFIGVLMHPSSFAVRKEPNQSNLIHTVLEKSASAPKWGMSKKGRKGGDPFHRLPLTFTPVLLPYTFTFISRPLSAT